MNNPKQDIKLDETGYNLKYKSLEGIPDAEPRYRLVTNWMDPAEAPALELAALYHQRWTIESSDFAVINHENFVCRADRRQAMCDHDRCHTRCGPREIIENRLFGRAVKCAGRFVEHEQSGAFQDRLLQARPTLTGGSGVVGNRLDRQRAVLVHQTRSG